MLHLLAKMLELPMAKQVQEMNGKRVVIQNYIYVHVHFQFAHRYSYHLAKRCDKRMEKKVL